MFRVQEWGHAAFPNPQLLTPPDVKGFWLSVIFWLAGAERSEAPVFGATGQPWRRPDAMGTPPQPPGK